MIYRITADIRYLDGNLAGMTISAGYHITTESRGEADRTQAWLNKVRSEGDFIRAAGTGCRYIVESVHREMQS